MKLKDLNKDIERFLIEDCYCPNEFYSFDGFGYMLFDKDTDVEFLGENENLIACIEKKSEKENQVLILFKEADIIVDNLRFDATDNNIEITKQHLLVDKTLGSYNFDEFKKGETSKMLNEILSLSNGIVIQD